MTSAADHLDDDLRLSPAISPPDATNVVRLHPPHVPDGRQLSTVTTAAHDAAFD